MKKVLLVAAAVAAMSTSAFATNYVSEMQECYLGNNTNAGAIADYNCAVFTALDAQDDIVALESELEASEALRLKQIDYLWRLLKGMGYHNLPAEYR